MSNGFAAGPVDEPFKDASWSTGSAGEVNSHRKRIEAAAGSKMAWVKNYAIEGTWAAKPGGHLATQAAKVPVGTAYVTISTGTSELCSTHIRDVDTLKRRVAKVEGGLRTTIATLTRRNPDVRIFVMSVPNWWQLWSTHQGDPAVADRWKTSPPICPLLLQDTATDETRNAINGRNFVVNSALSSACGDSSNCVFDDKALYNASWTAGELSEYDGFHWSYDGNAKAAALTWPEAGISGSSYDRLNLRILVNKARRLPKKRVLVSFDTFPDAKAGAVIKKGRRVVGRVTGRANGNGDFARKVAVQTTRGRLKVKMTASSLGQRKATTAVVS